MVNISLKDATRTRIEIAKTGKSLREFAKNIGVSHAYLSQILNEKRYPSPTVANKIAKGLGVDIDDIFLVEAVDVSNFKEAN